MAETELLLNPTFVSGPQIQIKLEQKMEDNHAFCYLGLTL